MSATIASSDTFVLSAVAVFGEQRKRAERCLGRLLAQTILDRIEIVIVDTADTPTPIAGSDHPRVRWLHRPELRTFGAARAEGIRQSRAPIVGFVEDHCYAEPRWAEAVVAAFEKPVDIVNYAMRSAPRQPLVSRIFLMVEYGRWLDPATSGDVPISASSNVAYRRSVVTPYLDRLDRLLEAEFLLHQEMKKAGARVWLAAEAKLEHENFTRFAEGVSANGVLKRLFGARRASEQGWGLPTRLTWAAAMALTPPLHFFRVARTLTRRPALWPLFWASAPVMAIVYTCGAWHEAMGYLFGEGGASERFRDMEISIVRQD